MFSLPSIWRSFVATPLSRALFLSLTILFFVQNIFAQDFELKLWAVPQTLVWHCSAGLYDYTEVDCYKIDSRDGPGADITLELAGIYSGSPYSNLDAYDASVPSRLFTDKSGSATINIDLKWSDCDSVSHREITHYGSPGSLLDTWGDVGYSVCWEHVVPMSDTLTRSVDPDGTIHYTGARVTLAWSADGSSFTGLVKSDVSWFSSYNDYPGDNSFLDGARSGGVMRSTRFSQQGPAWGWALSGNHVDIVALSSTKPKPKPISGGSNRDDDDEPEPPKRPPYIGTWYVGTPDAQGNYKEDGKSSIQDVLKAIQDTWGKLLGPTTIWIDPNYDAGETDFSTLNLNGKTLTIKSDEGDWHDKRDRGKIPGFKFSKIKTGGTINLEYLNFISEETCIDVDLNTRLNSKLDFNVRDSTFDCQQDGIHVVGTRAPKFKAKIADNKFILRELASDSSAINVEADFSKLEIVKNQFSYELINPQSVLTERAYTIKVWSPGTSPATVGKFVLDRNIFKTDNRVAALLRTGGGGLIYGNISYGALEFLDPSYDQVVLVRNTLLSSSGPAVKLGMPDTRYANNEDIPVLRAYHNIFGIRGIEADSSKNISTFWGNVFDVETDNENATLIRWGNREPGDSQGTLGSLKVLNSRKENLSEPNFIVPNLGRYLNDREDIRGADYQSHLKADFIEHQLYSDNPAVKAEARKFFNNFHVPLPVEPNDPPLVFKRGPQSKLVIPTPVDWSYDDPDIDNHRRWKEESPRLAGFAGVAGLSVALPDAAAYLLELYKIDKPAWDACEKDFVRVDDTIYSHPYPLRPQWSDARSLREEELEKFLQQQPETSIPSRQGEKLIADSFPDNLGDQTKKDLIAQYYAYQNQLTDGAIATLEKIIAINATIFAEGGTKMFNDRPDFKGEPSIPQTMEMVKKIKSCDAAEIRTASKRYIEDAYKSFVLYEHTKMQFNQLNSEADKLFHTDNVKNADRLAELGDELDALQKLRFHMEDVSPWLKEGAVREALEENSSYYHFDGFYFLDDQGLGSFNFEPAFKEYLEGLLPALWKNFDKYVASVKCLESDQGESSGFCGEFTKTLASAPKIRSWNVIDDPEDPNFLGGDLAGKALMAQSYLRHAECISNKRNTAAKIYDELKDFAINSTLVILSAATMGSGSAVAGTLAAGRTVSTAARLAQIGLWFSDIAFLGVGAAEVLEACGNDLKKFDESVTAYRKDFKRSDLECPNKKYDLKGTAALYDLNDCIQSAVINAAFNGIPGALAIKDAFRIGPAVIRVQVKLGKTLTLEKIAAVNDVSKIGLGELGRDAKTEAIAGNRTMDQLELATDRLAQSEFSADDIVKILEEDLKGLKPSELSHLLQRAKAGIEISQGAYFFKLGRSITEREAARISAALDDSVFREAYKITKAGEGQAVIKIIESKLSYVDRLALEDEKLRSSLLDALMSDNPARELDKFDDLLFDLVGKIKNETADLLRVMQDHIEIVAAEDFPKGGVHIGGELIRFDAGVNPETVWKNAIDSALSRGDQSAALEIAMNGVRSGMTRESMAGALSGRVNFKNVDVGDLEGFFRSKGRLIDVQEVKRGWETFTISPKKVAESNQQSRQWLQGYGIEPREKPTVSKIQYNYSSAKKLAKDDLFIEMTRGGVFEISAEDLKKIPLAANPTSKTPVWSHPEFRTRIKEITDKGYTVVLDDSATLAKARGYFDRKNKFIALTQRSDWQTLTHEYDHLLFDEAINKVGGFAKYVDPRPKLSPQALRDLSKSDPRRYRAIDLYSDGLDYTAIKEVMATDAEVALLVKEGYKATSIGPLKARSSALKHIIYAINKLGLNATTRQKWTREAAELQLAGIYDMIEGIEGQTLIGELTERQADIVKLTSALAVGGAAVVIEESRDSTTIKYYDPETGSSGEVKF